MDQYSQQQCTSNHNHIDLSNSSNFHNLRMIVISAFRKYFKNFIQTQQHCLQIQLHPKLNFKLHYKKFGHHKKLKQHSIRFISYSINNKLTAEQLIQQYQIAKFTNLKQFKVQTGALLIQLAMDFFAIDRFYFIFFRIAT